MPRGLFVHNPQLTDFTDAFKGCSALTIDADSNPYSLIKLVGFATGFKTQATLNCRLPSRVKGFVDSAKDSNVAIR